MSVDGKKPVRALIGELVYGNVIKHQRRRKTVEVERRIAWGEEKQYQERLKKAGLSGLIKTALIERVNLIIRQCVSKLTRRTWGPAKFTPELDVCKANTNTWNGFKVIITLFDTMKAWKRNWCSQSNEKENNNPGNIEAFSSCTTSIKGVPSFMKARSVQVTGSLPS
jgi:hypothetical protein